MCKWGIKWWGCTHHTHIYLGGLTHTYVCIIMCNPNANKMANLPDFYPRAVQPFYPKYLTHVSPHSIHVSVFGDFYDILWLSAFNNSLFVQQLLKWLTCNQFTAKYSNKYSRIVISIELSGGFVANYFGTWDLDYKKILGRYQNCN